MLNTAKAIYSDRLSDFGDSRYVIIDGETGEILDDAQGYGYKSKQKAYAGYAYKTRDKSKDKEKKMKEQHIKQWMKEHRSFMNLFEGIAFDIQKGSYGPQDKIDADLVNSLWEDQDLHPDFTAVEFLRVWRK